ncbi:hypothetical protein [Olivibacter sitiensis]|uniref:hypothetical protein n=1 Tax=Olivibacter sitiensis TaxID=376470 RepID=UPI0012F84355|nr:hypothetical protein [Olivibacter sitiensis]
MAMCAGDYGYLIWFGSLQTTTFIYFILSLFRSFPSSRLRIVRAISYLVISTKYEEKSPNEDFYCNLSVGLSGWQCAWETTDTYMVR